MVSFLFLLFFIDLLFIGITISIEGFLFLILLLPWTLFIYGILCYQGFRFSADDQVQQLAGKLFLISKGNVQATIIAIINIVLGILLVPNSSLIMFEEYFGIFTSTLLFLILPLPGFFINNLQSEDHERLYALIYQKMVRIKEKPDFIDQTSELLTKTERYSDEYRAQVEKVRENAFQFLEQNFQQIAPYFQQTEPLRLNVESLAIFLTKKLSETIEI
ncbi:MAG: hypothetical protein ACFFAU_00750 [Candidatus Hodarchaeota archaeon]